MMPVYSCLSDGFLVGKKLVFKRYVKISGTSCIVISFPPDVWVGSWSIYSYCQLIRNRFLTIENVSTTRCVMHQSFVTIAPPHPPHLRGRVEDSRAKVRGNYFSSVPAVYTRGNDRVLALESLSQGEFLL